MRQGDVGDRFVLVESGEIEISVDGRVINRMGPGAGVGEIALLKRRPRTATVIAVTEVHGYAHRRPDVPRRDRRTGRGRGHGADGARRTSSEPQRRWPRPDPPSA